MQLRKWAARMVNQYGREILPYVNETLMYADWDHRYKEPIDGTLKIYWYIFTDLMDKQLLSKEERQLYIVIFNGKINEYILKYRKIDYTLNITFSVLGQLGYSFETEEEEDLTSDTPLKVYYEKKLGIKGLLYSDLNEYTILDSPLSEYIID